MIPVRWLWVPGTFPSTNDVYALAKKEGAWFASVHPGLRKRATLPTQGYSWWARYVRQQTELQARAQEIRPVPPGERVDLGVFFAGHPRYDADGWTGAGKWMIDGLRDAHVLPSDRKSVRDVRGRCFSTLEEARGWLGSHPDMPVAVKFDRPGAVIGLEQVEVPS
jgi:hypothetical protein